MKNFLQQINSYIKEAFNAGKYLYNGLSVTFDHLRRRPVTVQYPYEKLIPSERYRGRIHYEFDKCIACEVCVRVCPINLPINAPFIQVFTASIGIVMTVLKAYLLVFIAILLRWTTPRVRIDQLLDLGWKFLLPISLANLLITAGLKLAFPQFFGG